MITFNDSPVEVLEDRITETTDPPLAGNGGHRIEFGNGHWVDAENRNARILYSGLTTKDIVD